MRRHCLTVTVLFLAAFALRAGELPKKVETPKPAAEQVNPQKTSPAKNANEKKKAPDNKAKKPGALTAEQLAARAKKSVVVVQFTGRDGKQQGLGTGFVISDDGLIATNYHVLGEARPLSVQLADGAAYDVTSIHASDSTLDLAVIKIGADKKLTPLQLGDSARLKQGQPIVALGHPQGLEYSIVSGVISGKRKLDDRDMIQLAIPIERGNSGGPVLDAQGKVIGIVTMKSLVTANLGFAVPINALKPLLERPNPIAMERWLTIGQLDKSEWTTMYGGRWRQHAGRIQADGNGTGFGGRSLCFYKGPVPKLPFEVTVTVKLDDEAGAAGLIFGGEEGDRHYGFYPSGGKLRLTRFQGSDVFTWRILEQIATPHYRPGEWNTLKIRIEKKRFVCYVNDHQVAEVTDPEYYGQVVGLAKFRTTVAEYKRFAVATKVPSTRVDEKLAAQLRKAITSLKFEEPLPDKSLQPLVKNAGASITLLREQARELEKQAGKLRELAIKVHHEQTLAELEKVMQGEDSKIDLGRAALLVARLDNEELDVDSYLKEMDRLAREVAAELPAKADAQTRLKALSKFIFKERGFHGSRLEYYTRSNSYLNEVLDDREGLPLTLSVLYMELARRLDLKMAGLALPGHFVVRHEAAQGPRPIIDVYDSGNLLTEKQAGEKVFRITGSDIDKKDFEPATKKAIIARMLHNLINVAQNDRDRDSMLRYLDGILAVDAESHEERWVRAVFRYQAGRRRDSLADVQYLLDNAPEGVDLARVRELQRILLRDK